MSDLIKRLRAMARFEHDDLTIGDEAADEIERLRAELTARRKSGSASDRLHNICDGLTEAADGSPFSREEWDRVDAEIVRLQRDVQRLRYERDIARDQVAKSVKLLGNIYALLYPAPIKTTDGRMMVFRPRDLVTHAAFQELSDRIRALPDQLAAIRAAEQALEPRHQCPENTAEPAPEPLARRPLKDETP